MTEFRTRQDYYNILKGLSENLGITGASGEVLIQLLSQSLYLSEVENVAFSLESSLERATLYNSKIQHCVDRMYSVYRGQCPRVVLNIKSQNYFNFKVYDEIATFSSFSLYYLGYFDGKKFVESPISIPPMDDSKEYTILCILAQKKITKEWTITENNTFYVDFLEKGLSEDGWTTICQPGDSERPLESTRNFSDHTLDPKEKLFCLTLPDFSCRFYGPDIFVPSTRLTANYFQYCTLEDFTEGELKSINLPGAILCTPTSGEWYEFQKINPIYKESRAGVSLIPGAQVESLQGIHYKANRERFLSGLLRSNMDLGLLLEELYPEKVQSTTYRFDNSYSQVINVSEYYTLVPKFNFQGTLGGSSIVDGFLGGTKKFPEILGYSGVTVGRLQESLELGNMIYQYYISLPGKSEKKVITEIIEHREDPSLDSLDKIIDAFNTTSSEVTRELLKSSIKGQLQGYLIPKITTEEVSSESIEDISEAYFSSLNGLPQESALKVQLPEDPGTLEIVYQGHLWVGREDRQELFSTKPEKIELPQVSPGEVWIYGKGTIYGITYKVEKEVLRETAEKNYLELFYIPKVQGLYLTTEEIEEFKEKRKGYYITNNIKVKEGLYIKAIFNLKLEVYENISLESEIMDILSEYEGVFGKNLYVSKTSESEDIQNIRYLISKISSVKRVLGLSVTFKNKLGEEVTWDSFKDSLDTTYFEIDSVINNIIC